MDLITNVTDYKKYFMKNKSLEVVKCAQHGVPVKVLTRVKDSNFYNLLNKNYDIFVQKMEEDMNNCKTPFQRDAVVERWYKRFDIQLRKDAFNLIGLSDVDDLYCFTTPVKAFKDDERMQIYFEANFLYAEIKSMRHKNRIRNVTAEDVADLYNVYNDYLQNEATTSPKSFRNLTKALEEYGIARACLHGVDKERWDKLESRVADHSDDYTKRLIYSLINLFNRIYRGKADNDTMSRAHSTIWKLRGYLEPQFQNDARTTFIGVVI